MKKYFYSLMALVMGATLTASAAGEGALITQSSKVADVTVSNVRALAQKTSSSHAQELASSSKVTKTGVSINGTTTQAPARAEGDVTAANVAGTYEWTYYSYLNPSGWTTGTLTMTQKSETEVEVVGIYGTFPVTANVAADGTFSIPKQFMFTNTYYNKDVYIMHNRWSDDGQSNNTFDDDIVGHYNKATGKITFDDYDNIVVTIPGQGYFLFAGSNTMQKDMTDDPNAKDYSLTVTTTDCVVDGQISVTVTAGADVASTKYICLNGNYSFSDANYSYTATNGKDFFMNRTASLNLGATAAGGRYCLFVAALDEEGNYVSGEGAVFYNILDNNDQWQSLGMAKYGEDIVASCFTDVNPSEYEVEIQENINKPGYYRLVNPYGAGFALASANKHVNGHNHYLYIDASDPENVVVEESPLGIDFGYGMLVANSFATIQKKDYGKLVDNKITFETEKLLVGMTGDDHCAWYLANNSNGFYVELPATETEVATLAEAKALENGTEFKLTNAELKVSFSNTDPEIDLTTVEDASTGARVKLVGAGDEITPGTKLTGTFKGTVYAGVLSIDTENSEYTVGTWDDSEGRTISLDDIYAPANEYTLVTFTNSDETPITFDEDMGWMIGETVISVDGTGFADEEDFEWPENIESLTGVLALPSALNMEDDMGIMLLLLRSADDVVAAEPTPALPVVETVADLKNAETLTEVEFQTAALTVTYFSEEQGMGFAQDATGGTQIQFTGDDIATGTVISGSLVGTAYAGMFLVDSEKSNYTTATTDVTYGKTVSLDEVSKPEYEYTLVTYYNTEETPITVDGMEIMVGGNKVAVVDMFADFMDDDDYVIPENIESVTGIIYPMDNMMLNDEGDGEEAGPTIMTVRSAADIVAAGSQPVEVSSVLMFKSLVVGEEENVVFNATDLKVTFASEGRAFLEDETGAMQAQAMGLEDGVVLNGKLVGNKMDGIFVIDVENSDYTATEADHSIGSIVTLDEITADHENCLLTIKSDSHEIKADPENYCVVVGGRMMVVDMFDALDWDNYSYPENIESVTGILMSMDIMGLDEGDDEPEMFPYFLVVRSANDIKAKNTDAINGIINDINNNADIYNMMGVKVGNASNLRNLPAGVYIIGGKKVMVK